MRSRDRLCSGDGPSIGWIGRGSRSRPIRWASTPSGGSVALSDRPRDQRLSAAHVAGHEDTVPGWSLNFRRGQRRRTDRAAHPGRQATAMFGAEET